MKYVVIVQNASRHDLRQFLLKRRQKFDMTRIEQLECWVGTQPLYAVESWKEAVIDCRKWNSLKKDTVHFPHKVMFFNQK